MSIRLNTAVPKIIDEVQKNRTEIKVLKVKPIWKDITTTYQTRIWKDDEAGKIVRITFNGGVLVAPISIIKLSGTNFISVVSGFAAVSTSGLTGYIYEYYQYLTTKDKVAIKTAGTTNYTPPATITKFEIME